eukprot:COSAG01_NODE_2854_length_6967_cov_27.753058_1_plen_46_part_10
MLISLIPVLHGRCDNNMRFAIPILTPVPRRSRQQPEVSDGGGGGGD